MICRLVEMRIAHESRGGDAILAGVKQEVKTPSPGTMIKSKNTEKRLTR